MDTGLLGLFVVLGSVVGPLLLAYLTGRQRSKEKAEDYARQDLVADRLTKKQDETAKLLLQSNAQVQEATEKTHVQLAEIHGMVDGNLTAALRAELEAVRQQRLLLVENAQLSEQAGHPISAAASAAIAALEARIAELSTTLGERMKTVAALQAVAGVSSGQVPPTK